MAAKELTVDLGALPSDIEGFVALRDQHAQSPEGGAAIFVAALLLYAKDAELGAAALTVAIDRSQLSEGDKGYKGFQPSNRELQAFKERIGSKPHVAHSYVVGTSPEKGYSLPASVSVRLRDQGLAGERDADSAKLFVFSTGADSPRPLALAKNNRGLWKARSWSSLTVGVRPPVTVVDDDL